MEDAGRIGRFTITREVGRGGVGVVFAARDDRGGEEVALKTLAKLDSRSLRRLKAEFRPLADVVHPNLVSLHELFVEDDLGYFTMELIDGVDFSTWVRGSGPAPDALLPTTRLADDGSPSRVTETTARPCPADETRLRVALADVARGVAALHAHGMLHRDLKPSNCAVRADGSVLVLDYGLVSDLEREHPRFEGTPAYAAPEQFTPGRAYPAADWYALGVMLFEALTGVLPFVGGKDQAVLDKRTRAAPRVRSLVPDAPADLADLADALLATRAEDRPSGEEIAKRLGSGPALASSGARPFIGRHDELGRLGEMFAVAEGRGASVVIIGPSGIGKSRLVEECLARHATSRDWILRGRCHPHESVPHNALDGVIDTLAALLEREPSCAPRQREIAAHMFPALALVAPEGSPAPGAPVREPRREGRGDPVEQRVRALAALREIFASAARSRRVVLYVDDLQWADPDSLSLLRALLDEPIPGVLALLTERTGEAGTRFDGITLELEVGPLPATDAATLCRSALPAAGEDDIARTLAEVGGHPLLLLEIARRTPADAHDAFDFDASVLGRARALPADARRVLELLGVSSPGMPEEVLLAAAEVTSDRRTRVMKELVSQGLLRFASGASTQRRLDTAHDRIREAIVAALPPATARAHHERLVATLESRADEVERLVRHVAATGDRRRAAVLARTSADRAFESLAFDRAATLYGLAQQTDDDLPLLHRLAEALVYAHRGVEAAELYLRIADRSPADASAARCRAAELLLTSGRLDRARGVVSDLLAEHRAPLPRSTAGAVTMLAVQRARLAAEMRWPALRKRMPDDELAAFRSVALGFGMVDNLRAAIYQTRWLRGAIASGDPGVAGQAIALEGIFRGSLGHRARKRGYELIAEAEALARSSGSPDVACWAFAARATVDALGVPSARHIEALETAVERFQVETRGNGWAITSLSLVRALTVRIRGDFEGVRRLLRASLADAARRGDLYLETTLRRGSTVLHLADDDPAAVRRTLQATEWNAGARGFHLQHWLALDAESEADLYEGRGHRTLIDRARSFRALDRSLVTRQQRVRILSRSLRARLHLAVARSGQGVAPALAATRKLADQLDAEQLEYARVRALLLRAACSAIEGEAGAAVAGFRATIVAADREGLELVREVARAKLGGLLGGDEGVSHREEARRWFARQRVLRPTALIDAEAPC